GHRATAHGRDARPVTRQRRMLIAFRQELVGRRVACQNPSPPGPAHPESGFAPASTRKPGRPRTPTDIRKFVIQIATENGWGYTRVLGELKKLGIRNVSRSTVANILKDAGLDTGPKRGEGTWT